MPLVSKIKPKVLRGAFVDAMSKVASTVSIVTTDGPAGRVGATVSAMSSVSADGKSPTLLVCLDQNGSASPAILANGVFSVNVLSEQQTRISDTFAGRFGDSQTTRFNCGNWQRAANGAPELSDCVTTFTCRVSASILVGTHYVIFGHVENVGTTDADTTLVYSRRNYAKYVPADEAGFSHSPVTDIPSQALG